MSQVDAMRKMGLSVIRRVVAVIGICAVVIVPVQAQTDCHVETNVNGLLSQTDERLVFFVDDSIQTPDGILLSNMAGLRRSSMSVAESRIAWTAYDVHTTTDLYIYDVQTETLTSLDIFDSEWIEPDIIQWVSADEIMIIYKTSKIKIPEWYPGLIINVDTRETDYIYPMYADHLFEDVGVASTPLVEVWEYYPGFLPRFSSNGQYLMLINQRASNYLVIDVENREIVQELESGIWSYDGEFVARFDDESNINVMMIYQVADDSVHGQLTIDGLMEIIWIHDYETSWSPDGHHIAFRERRQQTDHLSFIDMEQERVLTSCFVELESGWFIPFQFSWSSDGRYLAFYGVLDTVEEPETGTIYIYDTETDIAYEVFTGDAEIVGWLNLGILPESPTFR